MLPMRNLITPQVNSEGLWTMMKVVEKEMNVPMMRTQLSSLEQALTTGVFQYLHNTPEAMVVISSPVPAKNSAPRAQGLV